MKKHRGLLLGLGLAALLALPAPEANAGNLTMTVSIQGGVSQTFDFTNALFAQTGSTADNVIANVSAINTFLSSNGSAYQFAEGLGANSNNPGATTGANISETGTAMLTNPAGNTGLVVSVTQTAFTSPTGPGTLNSSYGGLFTGASLGNPQDNTSSFNGTNETPNTFLYASGLQNPNQFMFNASQPGLTAPGSYSLGLSTTIHLTSGKDQFTLSSTFVSVVPEPTGLILLLTGMPLPLVVMGLLRRRRGAA